MAFEVFTDAGARTQEFISVTETKSFGLSRAFLDKHGITADYKAVILYDPDTNRVALHFTQNSPKFGFAVRIANPKHGGNIVAKSFFDVKNIDTKRYAGRYSDVEKLPLTTLGLDKQGDAFVIQLKEREQQSTSEGTGLPHSVPEENFDEPISLDDIPF